MDLVENQEDKVLIDLSNTGRVRPWSEKASKARVLAEIYDSIDFAKAERLRNCASYLNFQVSSGGFKKLVGTNFCRVRLCPMCVWRRTLKVFAQTSAIMEEISKTREFQYIFLNLTMENCSPDFESLNEAIDSMMCAWHKLVGYKAFKSVVKGFYRGFEITHNLNKKSKFYNTFHPHFHCVLAVEKNYFQSENYISQSDWTGLWIKALGIDYKPIVFVKKVQGNTALAVAEIAKYTVKDADYIIYGDFNLTLDTVALLDRVLDKRRFVAFGGVFKDVHKRLNLDDPEDGDLVMSRYSPDLPDYRLVTYVWHSGYRQYVKS